MRIFLGLCSKMHKLKHFVHSLSDERTPRLSAFQAISNVFGDRQIGKQGIRLKNHAKVALAGRQRAQILAAQLDLPAIWCFEPGDQPQQSRFSAPGRPEERDELALGDFEVNATYSCEVTKALRYGLQDQKHWSCWSFFP